MNEDKKPVPANAGTGFFYLFIFQIPSGVPSVSQDQRLLL